MLIHQIRKVDDMAFGRIECEVEIETKNENHFIWLTTDKEYEDYLEMDRADAFVVLLLPLAMMLSEDIKCEAPITEDVKYGLTRDLIPSLSKHSENFHSIKIIAETIPPTQTEGKVGTGCSGGIDSLYTIKTNLCTEYQDFNVTHLCVFNNLTRIGRNQKMYDQLIRNAKKISKNLSLPLIACDSNCMELVPVPEDFNFLNTFVILFYVFSLQKLFGRYYLASNVEGYSGFSIENADKVPCSHYDLLTLSCLSTSTLRLRSSGAAVVKSEKTKEISDWNIAQKYLKVCNEKESNCCVCGKCRRTIMHLEALGKLDKYEKVFDLDNLDMYKNYYWLFKMHSMADGDECNEASYQKLKDSTIMKRVIENDKIWKYFIYAEGVYDDGWIQKNFDAKSRIPVNAQQMHIKIYIPNLIPKNTISILVNNKMILQKEVDEGLHEFKIPVSGDEEVIQWSINSKKSIVPRYENISDDIRELSCVLVEIEFS